MTRIRILFIIVLSFAAASCVNHAYDFDKIDPDITLLGEDIAIPLGQTGPLTIGALMGEKMADLVVPLDDGTCAIQYKGKAVNITLDELRKIDGAAPFQRFCDYPISYDFPLFSKPGSLPFNSQGEADLSSSIPERIELEKLSKSLEFTVSGFPSQITSLKSVTLTQKSRIDVTIAIPDCLLTSGTITPSLSLDMRNFLLSDEFPDGIIKINPTLNSANGYSATTTISLSKFVLGPNSLNAADHTLSLNPSITFSGDCTISQPKTNSDRIATAPQDTKLHITIVLRDLAIKEVEGSFDYSHRSQVSFQLGSLTANMPEKLKEDLRFDFKDPAVILDIESNITIPITARLDLAARQNNVKYAEVKNIDIALPLPSPGSFASKRYRLPGNFSSLLSRIPDDMLITADVATKNGQTAIFRLGENYRVSISPNIILPLSFGPGLKVAISDTLAMPAQLGSAMRQNSFLIKGKIENGFPLQFDFSLIMVDKDGAALTETVHQSIAPDAVSDIELNLAKLPEADPTQITSAIIVFKVDGIPDGRPVMADDAILANLYLVIPDGLHVTL